MNQQASDWNSKVEHAAGSHVGLRRSNNQDAFAAIPAGGRESFLERGHLFLVADGMGAHAAGELASKMAADLVPLSYQKLRQLPIPRALRAAVEEANARIHHRGQASDDFRGMGTTVSCLVLGPCGGVIGHVGDSRVYRLRGTTIEQLTFDHSLLWELRATGQVSHADAAEFIPRNVITRSLGPSAEVQVDIEGPFPVEPGDVFLLCSDGLSGQLTDAEMGMVVASLPPAEAVQALIDLANLRGGPDNITVVVVRAAGRLDGARPEEPPPAEPASTWPLALWGLAGFLLLAGLAAFVFDLWLLGIVGLLLAAVAALLGLSLRDAASREGPVAEFSAGRGPYAAADCRPERSFVATLADVTRQLREAAVDGGWSVAWDRFDALATAAEAAAKEHEYSRAVGEYCRAISFMMSELRHQPRPPAGGNPISMG